MATAENYAKSLVKKYLFSENVYQTDVIFSADGGRMLINGADINEDTKIYDYTTTKAFTSVNPTLDANLGSFSHDLSIGDTSGGFPFVTAQSLFEFRQGISDMRQFVLDLSNGVITFSNGSGGTTAITDASAVRLVDASNNAIQSGTKSKKYKAGVYKFTYDISQGALAANDSSGGATAGSLSHEVATANALLAEYPSKIIQQFNRLFFNNDGSKLYALYKDKTKGKGYPHHKTSAIQTFELTTPYTIKNVNNDLSNDHVIVYDISLTFNNSSAPLSYGREEVLGLFSQVSDKSFKEIMGFHISSDGTKIFFLSRRGKYKSEDTNENILPGDANYFGVVDCFMLPSAWDVSSGATHLTNALVYGTTSSTVKHVINVGINPLDINFNYDGTKLYILGTEGTKQYLYTYRLNEAYTLPDELSNGSRIEIKNNFLASLSSINNEDGGFKNLVGSGINGSVARNIIQSCVVDGNSFKLTSKDVLNTGVIDIITNNKLTNVIEHEKPKAKPKRNSFYPYNPDTSTIVTKQGEIKISKLEPGVSTIDVASQTLTFVGMVKKEENGVTYYALVFTSDYNNLSSAVVPLQVNLDNQGESTINSQPLNSETQALLKNKDN